MDALHAELMAKRDNLKPARMPEQLWGTVCAELMYGVGAAVIKSKG